MSHITKGKKMTKLNLFAIKDIKSELFSTTLMPVQTTGVAIRSFATACEDENTEFYKYPSDYSLYHLGTYDVETGIVESITPKQIANASEFVTSKKATSEQIQNLAKESLEVLEQATH